MSRPVEYSSALFLDTSMPAEQASPDASSGERFTELLQLFRQIYPSNAGHARSNRSNANQLAFGIRKLYILWQALEGKTQEAILHEIFHWSDKTILSLSCAYGSYTDIMDQLPPWCTNPNADCSSKQQETRQQIQALLTSIFTGAPDEQQWIQWIRNNPNSDVIHQSLIFMLYHSGLAHGYSRAAIIKKVHSQITNNYATHLSALWGIMFAINTRESILTSECIKNTYADPRNTEALANMHAVLQKLEELMKILKPLQNSVLHREYRKLLAEVRLQKQNRAGNSKARGLLHR